MPKLRGKRSISLISAVNNQLSLSDSVIFLRVSPKNVKNHFFMTKNQMFSQVIILIYRSGTQMTKTPIVYYKMHLESATHLVETIELKDMTGLLLNLLSHK